MCKNFSKGVPTFEVYFTRNSPFLFEYFLF